MRNAVQTMYSSRQIIVNILMLMVAKGGLEPLTPEL
jgi:hypothetical protein